MTDARGAHGSADTHPSAQPQRPEGLRPALADALAAAIASLRAQTDAASPAETDRYRPEAVSAVRSAGLHLIVLPAEAGGAGAGLAEVVEVLAALGAVDAGVALGLAMHLHVLGGLRDGDGWPQTLRELVYERVRSAGALLNAASTEESGGSPARGAVPGTLAVEESDGGFVLRGEKTWTTWLPALAMALVSARVVRRARDAGLPAPTEPESVPGTNAAGHDVAEGPPEVGLFLLDMDARGVERKPGFDALGMRASASGRLLLGGVRVSPERVVQVRRVGAPDPRGVAPPAWFGLCIAAVYLGVGEGARADVTRWAIDRRPGDGSTSVADLPSVRVRLGRADAALRTARTVLRDVAARWDRTDPVDRPTLMPDVSLAKVQATSAAVGATDEALRIAGGPGFLAGRLERAFRDARAGLINPPLEDVAYQAFAAALIERERAS